MDVTRASVLDFLRSHSLAVQSSVAVSGAPQAAVVGFAVTDDFEIVFDTLESTRKARNLRHNRRCAVVIGGLLPGDERTAQIEGLADEPVGSDLGRLKEIYFSQFPEGRDRQQWRGLIYVRIRPIWLRYSDLNQSPPIVVEFTF